QCLCPRIGVSNQVLAEVGAQFPRLNYLGNFSDLRLRGLVGMAQNLHHELPHVKPNLWQGQEGRDGFIVLPWFGISKQLERLPNLLPTEERLVRLDPLEQSDAFLDNSFNDFLGDQIVGVCLVTEPYPRSSCLEQSKRE